MKYVCVFYFYFFFIYWQNILFCGKSTQLQNVTCHWKKNAHFILHQTKKYKKPDFFMLFWNYFRICLFDAQRKKNFLMLAILWVKFYSKEPWYTITAYCIFRPFSSYSHQIEPKRQNFFPYATMASIWVRTQNWVDEQNHSVFGHIIFMFYIS